MINDFNFVNQAELLAILRALEWISEQSYHVYRVYSGCLFCVQTIFVHRDQHPTVLKIKQQLIIFVCETSLCHESTHIGIGDNERADARAKAAA